MTEKTEQFGLDEKVIRQITAVLANYPDVETAILYGSRAKGNYRKGSDIDLTLKGQNLTVSTVFNIECEIDDLLLPYLFDISIFSHIDNPNLVDHIHRVGVTLYSANKSSSVTGSKISSDTSVSKSL